MTNVEKFQELIHILPGSIKDFVSQVDESDDWDSVTEALENMQEASDLAVDLFTLCNLMLCSSDDEQKEMVGMLASELDDAIILNGIAEHVDGLVIKLGLNVILSLIKKKVSTEQLSVVRKLL